MRFSRPAPTLARTYGLAVATLLLPVAASAQVRYVARFTLEKQSFLLGEPVFCTFSIHNFGTEPFAFSYRNPSRIVNPELEGEPMFIVVDSAGNRVPDPAPRPCGGAKGTAVYGSVSLPAGQVHTERWLINEWARLRRPGKYRLRAERRLPLLGLDAAKEQFTGAPVAYAVATNDLAFEVMAAGANELQVAFEPYKRALERPGTAGFGEALLAVTTLPQPFLLENLAALASASAQERQWDRERVLVGLARLGTRAAWNAILETARGRKEAAAKSSQGAPAIRDDPARAYAILLLAEKGDPGFLPSILALLEHAPENLRGEIIRSLGLFHNARANQVLFEKLHSSVVSDRVNAILGLRNLESRDAIPALIAMLNDPEAQVRQVANFALERLTGQSFRLSSSAQAAESAQVEKQWRAWWREEGARFVPIRQPPCRDW